MKHRLFIATLLTMSLVVGGLIAVVTHDPTHKPTPPVTTVCKASNVASSNPSTWCTPTTTPAHEDAVWRQAAAIQAHNVAVLKAHHATLMNSQMSWQELGGIHPHCWNSFVTWPVWNSFSSWCDFTLQPGLVRYVHAWWLRNGNTVDLFIGGAAGVLCAFLGGAILGVVCGIAVLFWPQRFKDALNWAVRDPGVAPYRFHWPSGVVECVKIRMQSPYLAPFSSAVIRDIRSVGSGYGCDRRAVLAY